MPTKMSMAEKQMMADILNEDLAAVSREINKQFAAIWKATRLEIEHDLGFDTVKAEIAALNDQIREIQIRISESQNSLREHGETPDLNDYLEAGADPPLNTNGYIYSHNTTFMGHAISTKLDLLIVQKIKERMDSEQPLRMLQEVAKAALRGLIMSGTYEEGRPNYEAFYALDFQRYGVEIPRRLTEIRAVAGSDILNARLESSIHKAEEAGKLLPESVGDSKRKDRKE